MCILGSFMLYSDSHSERVEERDGEGHAAKSPWLDSNKNTDPQPIEIQRQLNKMSYKTAF